MPKIEVVKPMAAEAVDESNLSAYRLSQDFLESGGAKKVLSTVPVRKPHPQHFIRVHPEPAFRQPFAMIELKEDREHYLVAPPIAAALPAEIVSIMLFTAITRQKVIFLWPVRLPAADGRSNEWHRSAMEHAERAMQAPWIRVIANMGLGAYEAIEAPGNLPEPEWPDCSFDDLLRIGFRDRIIKSFDHAVLKRLRGEC
jgi:hypothetical protein